MRTIALIRKSLIIIASLAALTALGGSDNTSATGTAISPTPSTIWVVRGAWFDSGVTLSAQVDSAQTNILISDKNFLIAGMLIKVDTEYMLIEELIAGPVHQPDTMVVSRAQNGSTATAHASGAAIKAQTVNVDIYAKDVTDPLGLGSFQIYMVLPPEVQYVQMVPQEGWLDSTGRQSWCDGHNWGNTWTVSCTTTGAEPAGPIGSGVIAKLTLLPLQDLVTVSTIDFSGSLLLNTHVEPIPATVRNLTIKVLECPDVNQDTYVDSGDLGQVARNLGDAGVDSGAILVDGTNATQTTNITISDLSMLAIGDTISIDMEQMTVSALREGSIDTMTVVRAVNGSWAAFHSGHTPIFRATEDNNHDGKKGYTDPRDINDDGYVDSGDFGTIARTMGVLPGGSCPP